MTCWRENFRLRNYEIGPDGRGKTTTMMNLFQEAASHHADELGIGFSQLMPKGIGWALTKFQLHMDRYPEYGETVSLRTWPRGRKKIFAYRDVEYSIDNEVIGKGTSIWCLIDLKERKALSLKEEIPNFPDWDERLFDEEIANIPSLKEVDRSWDTKARLTELDLNGHVNNSVYLGWAVEPVPYEFIGANLPKDITFLFKKEATLGTTICSKMSFADSARTIHSLTDGDDKELARMSINWSKSNCLKNED